MSFLVKFSIYRITRCLSFTHTDSTHYQPGNSDRSCDNETGLTCLMICTPRVQSRRCFFSFSPLSNCQCVYICLLLTLSRLYPPSRSVSNECRTCPCGALERDAVICCKEKIFAPTSRHLLLASCDSQASPGFVMLSTHQA